MFCEGMIIPPDWRKDLNRSSSSCGATFSLMSNYWRQKTSHHDDTKLHTTPKDAGQCVTRHVHAWDVNDRTGHDTTRLHDW